MSRLMRHEHAADSIEQVVDAAAAIVLAGALGFACFAIVGGLIPALGSSVVAGLATWLMLQRIPLGPLTHRLPDFARIALEFVDEEDELQLTEDMAVAPANELLLDDILQEIGPDARVVRLFASPVLPTAGELGATIDRHLQAGAGRFEAPDASDALMNALSDLRRSLR